MSDPFAEYEALVERLEKERAAERPGVAARPRLELRRLAARWLLGGALVAAALVLPFWVLVGSSVFLYRHYAVPTWPALLAGLLLTALVLLIYAAWVSKRLAGKARLPGAVTKTVFAVVGAYCLYALIYLSSLNVKGTELRQEYRSLHPLLRLATSTFILVDRDLVVTDMERQAQDYERMGLPLHEHSLHFIQEDGYAHAVDLRTVGRSAWRNFLLRAYYGAMGFRTLRHVGTADHLHVSLPLP